jgi:hypothetical protein
MTSLGESACTGALAVDRGSLWTVARSGPWLALDRGSLWTVARCGRLRLRWPRLRQGTPGTSSRLACSLPRPPSWCACSSSPPSCWPLWRLGCGSRCRRMRRRWRTAACPRHPGCRPGGLPCPFPPCKPLRQPLRQPGRETWWLQRGLHPLDPLGKRMLPPAPCVPESLGAPVVGQRGQWCLVVAPGPAANRWDRSRGGPGPGPLPSSPTSYSGSYPCPGGASSWCSCAGAGVRVYVCVYVCVCGWGVCVCVEGVLQRTACVRVVSARSLAMRAPNGCAARALAPPRLGVGVGL